MIHKAPVLLDDCIWPNENVWAILKDRVKAKEPKSESSVEKVNTQVWRDMDRDKNMCKRLISSISYRLQAVTNVGGRQITKADYR